MSDDIAFTSIYIHILAASSDKTPRLEHCRAAYVSNIQFAEGKIAASLVTLRL